VVTAILAFVGYKKIQKVRAPQRAIEQAEQAKQMLTGPRPAGSGTAQITPRSPASTPPSS
jgi:hypothetical protein